MLLEAPNCMKAWRDVERAVYYINHGVKGWEGRLIREGGSVSTRSPEVSESPEATPAGKATNNAISAQPPPTEAPCDTADVKPASKSERRNARFENLCEHMLSWGYPTHVLEYIKLVLIARGAAKVR